MLPLFNYDKHFFVGIIDRAGCANVDYTVTNDTFNNPYCFYRLGKEGMDGIKIDRPEKLRV